MKTILDDRTKLVTIVGIEIEMAKLIFQYLKSWPEKRSAIAGHWRYSKKTKTFMLVLLTLEQVVMLDVVMCSSLRQLNDLIECLDNALEMAIGEILET